MWSNDPKAIMLSGGPIPKEPALLHRRRPQLFSGSGKERRASHRMLSAFAILRSANPINGGNRKIDLKEMVSDHGSNVTW